jgi:hypothetical protein
VNPQSAAVDPDNRHDHAFNLLDRWSNEHYSVLWKSDARSKSSCLGMRVLNEMSTRDRDMKEAARELAKKSRVAQGLSPKIIDPVVIDRVMRLIYLWRDPSGPNEPKSPGR